MTSPNPAAEDRVSDKICALCGGSGSVGVAEHHPDCDDVRCSPRCPIEVERHCLECGGSGRIPIKVGAAVPPSEDARTPEEDVAERLVPAAASSEKEAMPKCLTCGSSMKELESVWPLRVFGCDNLSCERAEAALKKAERAS